MVDDTGRIRVGHLHRVERRSERLIGGRVPGHETRGRFVPEVAADEIAGARPVELDGRERRVAIAHGLAPARAVIDRADIRNGRVIEQGTAAGEAFLQGMARRAGDQPVDRQIPVINHDLSQDRLRIFFEVPAQNLVECLRLDARDARIHRPDIGIVLDGVLIVNDWTDCIPRAGLGAGHHRGLCRCRQCQQAPHCRDDN